MSTNANSERSVYQPALREERYFRATLDRALREPPPPTFVEFSGPNYVHTHHANGVREIALPQSVSR